MAHKNLAKLLESHIILLDKLGGQLERHLVIRTTGIPRQQMVVLVRLYMGGRARLKDIARRELVPTPNLCITFRKLENEGLILRTIDDADRRNTWYQVTESGAKLARQAMDNFYNAITETFKNLPHAQELDLINALQTINNILVKME